MVLPSDDTRQCVKSDRGEIRFRSMRGLCNIDGMGPAHAGRVTDNPLVEAKSNKGVSLERPEAFAILRKNMWNLAKRVIQDGIRGAEMESDLRDHAQLRVIAA